MSGYAKPGCSADHVTHGCAGPVCQVGWVEDEARVLAASVPVDLSAYKQPIAQATFTACAALVRSGQSRMSQEIGDLHTLIDDQLKGVATEFAVALHAGWPTSRVGTTRKGQPDFDTPTGPVDVKYSKPRPRRQAFTINELTWAKERGVDRLRYVAATFDPLTWTARILGHVTAVRVAELDALGLIEHRRPHYRKNGSGYLEVRAGLLTPMREAS